jgi:A/G-specific adenine glycosylase
MKEIGDVLINWYIDNKRNLPWRSSKNPYIIWVSEIILQQTRISQGINYFKEFIATFPDINKLAFAENDEILKVWKGLGYYSRALNMKKAALQIVEKYNGVFPENSIELIKLKGIGSYTSAAIASICFNEKIAVVDGNVVRWISRMNGYSDKITSIALKKKVSNMGIEYMNNHNPGIFNQAMMEFGALFCIPQKPNCNHCIFTTSCIAKKSNIVHLLPVSNETKKPKKRYFNYFVIIYNDSVLMRKRTEKDIWKELYEFPLIETKTPIPIKKLLKNDNLKQWVLSSNIKIKSSGLKIKHILSHQIIFTSFYKIDHIENFEILLSEFNWISLQNIDTIPYSRLIENYIKKELIIT